MDNESILKEILVNAAKELDVEISASDVVIERCKDPIHGDYSTNVAMKFSKLFKSNPRDAAAKIVALIKDEHIEKIEIAGPGFINFFMKQEALANIVSVITKEDTKFGQLPKNGKKINVEFVSANPTGDLHLGHTRCAAIGDSICRLYEAAGYDVTREYYLNDCGNQIEHLGHSLRGRYHELFGEPCSLDLDDYHGEDIIKIAKDIKEKFGDKYLTDNQESHDFFISFGMDEELKKIWKNMDDFGVKFNVLTKESEIRKSGKIEETIEELKKYEYVHEGATYLKTTDFVDDKDRPIIKSDGLYTYFMPDIAYHYNKMARGYDLLIDILGADHHGYLNRIRSVLMMKGYPKESIDFELVQVVRTFKDGKEVKMSKRTGEAITHVELIDEVGKDAVRYFFVERSPSSHLDFNYNLATEQSSSNPVYYAQYAHARCCSILNQASDIKIDTNASLLVDEAETALLKHLADFSNMISSAAVARAPYKVAAYIQRLATLIHEFYSKCRVIDRDNILLTSNRLALINCCRIVMRNALNLIGVSAPERM